MSIKTLLGTLVENINVDEGQKLNTAFNFIILENDHASLFHISLNENGVDLNDGLATTFIGQMEAKDETLQALVDMGVDTLDMMMKYTVPSGQEKFELPKTDLKIFIETASSSYQLVLFNIFIKDKVLHIVEGENMEADIHIRIKPSFLPELIAGDANIPMAFLTGKIKISNKRELFQLLAKFGLKF